MAHTREWQHTTHSAQHTTHNTQHTTHNTQHTTHNTAHNTQHTNLLKWLIALCHEDDRSCICVGDNAPCSLFERARDVARRHKCPHALEVGEGSGARVCDNSSHLGWTGRVRRCGIDGGVVGPRHNVAKLKVAVKTRRSNGACRQGLASIGLKHHFAAPMRPLRQHAVQLSVACFLIEAMKSKERTGVWLSVSVCARVCVSV